MNTLGWQIGAFLIGASALIIAVYIGKLLMLLSILKNSDYNDYLYYYINKG